MSQGVVFPTKPISKFKIDTVFADSAYDEERYGVHTGWDINGVGGGNTDLGVPFQTVAAGKVVYVSDDAGGSWGGLIVVEHETCWTRYGHHRPGSARVHLGQRLKADQTIGEFGRGAGNKMFAHLHFDVLKKLPPRTRVRRLPWWAIWPMYDLDMLEEYFQDPREFFQKRGVFTPVAPKREQPLATLKRKYG
jgi:murein DD-endopeptidase MepM/ murein hydrolase activator NlpD